MKTAIQTIITDINHVFVKGQSNNVEQARVFFLLALPLFTLLFTLGQFPLH